MTTTTTVALSSPICRSRKHARRGTKEKIHNDGRELPEPPNCRRESKNQGAGATDSEDGQLLVGASRTSLSPDIGLCARLEPGFVRLTARILAIAADQM